jgi:hypothetical protein
MLKPGTLTALLALMVVSLSGCTTALKQAYYEFRGADAKLVPVQRTAAGALDPINSVRFLPPTSTTSPLVVTPTVLRTYETASQRAESLLNSHLPGGNPMLTIDSELIFLQEKGLLSSGMLLVRIKMTEGGRLVADGISQAETKSFRKGGEDDLAKVAAGAVAKYIAEQKGIELEEDEDEE